jgi:RNA polymerase primary sigma factor
MPGDPPVSVEKVQMGEAGADLSPSYAVCMDSSAVPLAAAAARPDTIADPRAAIPTPRNTTELAEDEIDVDPGVEDRLPPQNDGEWSALLAEVDESGFLLDIDDYLAGAQSSLDDMPADTDQVADNPPAVPAHTRRPRWETWASPAERRAILQRLAQSLTQEARQRGFVTLHELARAAAWLRYDAQLLDELCQKLDAEAICATMSVARTHLSGASTEGIEARFAPLFARRPNETAILRRLGYTRGDHLSAETRAFLVQAFELHQLTRVQEEELFRAVIAANEQPEDETLAAPARSARQALFHDNLWLVARLAQRYEGQGLDLDDLLQVGCMGLWTAIDRHRPELVARFMRYAAWWITQRMRRAIADLGRTIRLPVHLIEEIDRVRQAERARDTDNAPADDATFATGLGIDEARLASLRRWAQPVVSLDRLEERRPGFIERLLTRELGIDDSLETGIAAWGVRTALQDVLAALPHRQRDVVLLRSGFGTGKRLTLEEIARRYGLTRERIRQLEKKGLEQLAAGVRKSPVLCEYVQIGQTQPERGVAKPVKAKSPGTATGKNAAVERDADILGARLQDGVGLADATPSVGPQPSSCAQPSLLQETASGIERFAREAETAVPQRENLVAEVQGATDPPSASVVQAPLFLLTRLPAVEAPDYLALRCPPLPPLHLGVSFGAELLFAQRLLSQKLSPRAFVEELLAWNGIDFRRYSTRETDRITEVLELYYILGFIAPAEVGDRVLRWSGRWLPESETAYQECFTAARLRLWGVGETLGLLSRGSPVMPIDLARHLYHQALPGASQVREAERRLQLLYNLRRARLTPDGYLDFNPTTQPMQVSDTKSKTENTVRAVDVLVVSSSDLPRLGFASVAPIDVQQATPSPRTPQSQDLRPRDTYAQNDAEASLSQRHRSPEPTALIRSATPHSGSGAQPSPPLLNRARPAEMPDHLLARCPPLLPRRPLVPFDAELLHVQDLLRRTLTPRGFLGELAVWKGFVLPKGALVSQDEASQLAGQEVLDLYYILGLIESVQMDDQALRASIREVSSARLYEECLAAARLRLWGMQETLDLLVRGAPITTLDLAKHLYGEQSPSTELVQDAGHRLQLLRALRKVQQVPEGYMDVTSRVLQRTVTGPMDPKPTASLSPLSGDVRSDNSNRSRSFEATPVTSPQVRIHPGPAAPPSSFTRRGAGVRPPIAPIASRRQYLLTLTDANSTTSTSKPAANAAAALQPLPPRHASEAAASKQPSLASQTNVPEARQSAEKPPNGTLADESSAATPHSLVQSCPPLLPRYAAVEFGAELLHAQVLAYSTLAPRVFLRKLVAWRGFILPGTTKASMKWLNDALYKGTEEILRGQDVLDLYYILGLIEYVQMSDPLVQPCGRRAANVTALYQECLAVTRSRLWGMPETLDLLAHGSPVQATDLAMHLYSTETPTALQVRDASRRLQLLSALRYARHTPAGYTDSKVITSLLGHTAAVAPAQDSIPPAARPSKLASDASRSAPAVAHRSVASNTGGRQPQDVIAPRRQYLLGLTSANPANAPWTSTKAAADVSPSAAGATREKAGAQQPISLNMTATSSGQQPTPHLPTTSVAENPAMCAVSDRIRSCPPLLPRAPMIHLGGELLHVQNLLRRGLAPRVFLTELASWRGFVLPGATTAPMVWQGDVLLRGDSEVLRGQEVLDLYYILGLIERVHVDEGSMRPAGDPTLNLVDLYQRCLTAMRSRLWGVQKTLELLAHGASITAPTLAARLYNSKLPTVIQVQDADRRLQLLQGLKQVRQTSTGYLAVTISSLRTLEPTSPVTQGAANVGADPSPVAHPGFPFSVDPVNKPPQEGEDADAPRTLLASMDFMEDL